MSPDHWRQLEELFESALELPPPERGRFLDEQCAGDETLRREVEEMLVHGAGGETIAGLVQHAATGVARERDTWEGRRVGAYRILRTLGTGGMGAVFLAVRDDDQYRKEVAIKTLKFEASDSLTINRFRGERQVLARLEHPNIARLLDGGETANGTPYIVMDYIPGVPITDYCRERQMGIDARVRLFRQVCDAVQYAHQNLIVHRDVKPANILVTADGVPKLLDFGIAKLLDPGGTDTAARTATGFLLMTPEYASPEQVRGEPISTATDVYQLGAVLYEVLTGRCPHPLDGVSASEVARVVCEMPVRAPSVGGERSLRGDLDNIVLKALQKDPARRYPSASQLSEDLGRYLEGLPVLAQPDSLSYRMRKYVRRHWVGVAAASAVALSLTVGLAVALHQARIAGQRFQQVRKLANRFLFEFDDRIRTLPGSTAAREMLVATALEYLDSLARDARSDPGLQWELAKAYEKVGDVQGSPVMPSLGKTQGALDSYRKAIAIQEELGRRGLLDPPKRESLVKAYLELSAIYRTAGTGQEAIKAAQQGLERAEGLPEAVLLQAHAVLAHGQLVAGEPLEALESARRVFAGYEAGVAANSVPRATSLYVTAGRAAQRIARFEESAAFFEQGIRFRELDLAAPVLDPLSARGLVLLYHGAGDTLGAMDRFSLGRPRDAEPYYRKALALAERLSNLDRDNATARLEVARSAGKLASVLDEVRPHEAIRLYEQAREIAEALLPEGPDRQAMMVAADSSLAIPLASLGRTDEARRRLQSAVAACQVRIAANPGRFDILNDLADAWRSWGMVEMRHRPDAAIRYYRNALTQAEEAVKLAPRDLAVAFRQASSLEELTAALVAVHAAPGEVRELRRRLVELWRKWDGLLPGSPFVRNRLAKASAAAGQAM